MKYVFMLAVLLMPFSLTAQDLTGVKCLVKPEADAKATTAVDYQGGRVFFCCKMCAGKFSEHPENWAAKANYQLVATGQFVQKACPVSGHDVAGDVTAQVGSLQVGLCCNQCKAKLDQAAELADKIGIAFGPDAFKKGFEPAEKEIDLTGIKCPMMPDDDVSADTFVEFNGGKLYFCCDHCVTEFDKDNVAHVSVANRQLVQTGQFRQTACPFSGQPVSADATTSIGDMPIGFCCLKCRDKVRDAADDGVRTEMVFGQDAFAKGFAKSEK